MYLSEALENLGLYVAAEDRVLFQGKPRTVKRVDKAILAVAPRLSRRAELLLRLMRSFTLAPSS